MSEASDWEAAARSADGLCEALLAAKAARMIAQQEAVWEAERVVEQAAEEVEQAVWEGEQLVEQASWDAERLVEQAREKTEDIYRTLLYTGTDEKDEPPNARDDQPHRHR